ncbi:metal ABC transporter permease [Cucumibacter marinus]|uniref:metal ABC transporter permease n=1 Tax=Cucumibacter marinus TaxID=1121252 RepID=UPI00387E1B4B
MITTTTMKMGRVTVFDLSDFLVRAALGGVLLALMTGPLGGFVIWRRLAYFGDTMAHSALLGVTLALGFSMSVEIGIFVVALAVALILNAARLRVALPSDALLGVLSHAALATGLVVISLVGPVRVDLMAFLFGDILALTRSDLLILFIGAAVVLAALAAIWQPLLADTVSPDLAAAEGQPTGAARLIFMLLLAGVVALSIKLVGVLLITAMLIMPAATARMGTRSPEAMAIGAAGIGVTAVFGGLGFSYGFDTPTGPSIVMVSAILFVVAAIAKALIGRGD